MRWNPFQPFFNENEAWGQADKMSWSHIHNLWMIRKRLFEMGCDWPMVIHNAYATSGHSRDSYHYEGMATDFHFKTDASLQEQVIKLGWALLDLRLSKFMGIGIYPNWSNPGFHIDSRGIKQRWVRVNGEYVYGMDKMRDIVCNGNLACRNAI